MVNIIKKGDTMMKERDLTTKTAKMMVSVLNKMLKVDANSTSCIVVYQPKAPKELENFRNAK